MGGVKSSATRIVRSAVARTRWRIMRRTANLTARSLSACDRQSETLVAASGPVASRVRGSQFVSHQDDEGDVRVANSKDHDRPESRDGRERSRRAYDEP